MNRPPGTHPWGSWAALAGLFLAWPGLASRDAGVGQEEPSTGSPSGIILCSTRIRDEDLATPQR